MTCARSEDSRVRTPASILVLVLAFGCGRRVQQGSVGEDTTSTTAGDTTGGTASPSGPTTSVDAGPTGDGTPEATGGSSSGGPLDPEAFCAQFLDRDGCQQAEAPSDVFCGWTVSTPVRLVDGACQLNTANGVCALLTGDTTVGGCFPPEGCDSEPFFLPGDSEVFVIFQCGGSLPVGYEPCVLVEPGLFDPPECGCLCDEGFGTSDGTGATDSTG